MARVYGLLPWDVEQLSLAEVREFLRDLDERPGVVVLFGKSD